ncbi:MAG: hypothetical protein LBP83_07305 [Dysgonamonadaceae bacterium]|jgi:hypothetical protein|nr:hypothetical protein [Dysgonamonadaceae bacterium]
MKNTKYVAGVIIALCTVIACVDKPDLYEFPVEKYYYDIPDVPVTEDYVVGVRYEVTDSGYWFNKTTNKAELYTGHPVLGKYTLNSFAPNRMPSEALRQHLEWGKKAGIDFFIVGWGGFGWNDTLLREWGKLYDQDNQYPQVVIRYDPGYMLNKSKLAEKPETSDTLQIDPLRMDSLRHDFDSLYTTVMTKPYAYKNKNGDPVMVFCNFVDKPAELRSLPNFIQEYRKIAGNKLWIMGELGGNWTSPEKWGYRDATTIGPMKADTISNFDAVFITDVATDNYERWTGYYSFMDFNYNYWQERMRPLGKEYIPIIFPAFDNKVREPSNNNFIFPRWDPQTDTPYVISAAAGYQDSGEAREYNMSSYKENPYKTAANVAKRNVGASRILLVYSWNDFRNGINLEPTTEIKEDYLDYTRQFFKK